MRNGQERETHRPTLLLLLPILFSQVLFLLLILPRKVSRVQITCLFLNKGLCHFAGYDAVAIFILRMPYVTLISVLIAVTALVPLVGGFIGCFLGAFFILVNDPMQALIFVIVFLVIQQIEGNLIYPKVVGGSIGLPGMWVLAAVTVFGGLFGVLGMIIGVPLAATVYAIIRDHVKNKEQEA